jgi:hypothetical protein
MALLVAAIAGLLMGGGIAFYRQRKPVWIPITLFVAALLTLWWAATLTKAQA